MSPELIAYLVERYPKFFPPEDTVAGKRARSIDCGDGWANLIEHLLGTLSWQVKTSPLERMRQPVLDCIDRSNGGLRIEFRRPSRRVLLLSNFTESLALEYCEMCGKPYRHFCGSMAVRRCTSHPQDGSA